jgi:acyl-coenzyme A thioesterase PaaI-like protein
MTASEHDDHPLAGADAAQRMVEALTGGGAAPSPRQAATYTMASATRRVIAELMSTAASDDAIAEAARLVAQAAALLAGGPHGRPYEGVAESSVGGDPRAFVDYSPVAGPANPVAPPLEIDVVGDSVVGRGVFGDAYEGPPGCVHGGFIAAAFDEVLGFAQSLTGRPGMTGRLSIAYRSPTPLHRPLRFTGRVERTDGRKIFTRATLHYEHTLCAEAEALFISIDPEVFANLMAARAVPDDGTHS